MTDKSFEKQIAEKLQGAEMSPSEGLLEKVLEKRVSRSRPFSALGTAGAVLISVAFVSGLISLVIWGSQEKEKPSLAQHESVSGQFTSPESLDQETDNKENAQKKVRQSETELAEYDATTYKVNSLPKASLQTGKLRQTRSSRFSGEYDESGRQAELNQASGFRSADDYFNLNSGRRPVITDEQHRGNSHLYSYKTAEDQDYADHGFLFSRLSEWKVSSPQYQMDALSPAIGYRSILPPVGKTGRPVFADILFTPSYGTQMVNGKTAADQTGKSTSAYVSSVQAGVRLTLPVQGRIGVHAGLFYREQHTAYKGTVGIEKDATRMETRVSYINDPVQGVIKVTTVDTISYRAQSQEAIDHKNTYKMMQIPLGFSYMFGYKRFDFALNTSVLCNIIMESSGVRLGENGLPERTFQSDKRYMGLGGSMGLMAAYRVSPQIRIVAEPGFQYFGLDGRKAGNSIYEKVLAPQISLGLRYTVF